MKRIRLMLSGAYPTLIFIAFLASLAYLFGGDWPNDWYRHPIARPVNNATWVDTLIFLLGSAFLLIKSTIMLQRMGKPADRLTLALVSANFAFSAIYLYAVFRPMFGPLLMRHPGLDEWVGLGLRFTVPWTLAWGIWILTNTPPGSGYVLTREEDGDATDDERPVAWSQQGDRPAYRHPVPEHRPPGQ